MKEIKVSVNSWYVVEGTAGATVTNPSTNRVIATIEEGKQAAFYATTPYVLASDDSVSVYKSTFNLAPVKLRLLGLLGGGVSSVLPRGYLAAEFLESTGPQYINTNKEFTLDTGILLEGECLTTNADIKFAGCLDSTYGDIRFYAPRVSKGPFYYPTAAWGEWFFLKDDNSLNDRRFIGETNYLNNRKAKITIKNSADLIKDLTNDFDLEKLKLSIFLFGLNSNSRLSNNYACRIWQAKISRAQSIVFDGIPCISSLGEACMYDKVTKKPFRNSGTGAFIVGMTLAQAINLSKLPAGGGTLTISLPTGYESDAGVVSALETARSNGWTLTVQTYTPEAEASSAATFALRRIWVQRTQHENGAYIDADGNRWQVDWCVEMYTPDGSTPDMHGYELFRSLDAAVAYWELEPYVDPNEEELLTEYNANE